MTNRKWGFARQPRGFRLAIPVWTRRGVGYDICTDDYQSGGWTKFIAVTVSREYQTLIFRINWGEVIR